MPVVLGPETWPAWLGEEPPDARQLKAMLAPYPSEEMVAWPVSPRVGNVKNNDPSLIEPIAGMVRLSGSGGPEEAMNWHRRLAALLVMPALAACAQGGQVPQAPSEPQSPENVHEQRLWHVVAVAAAVAGRKQSDRLTAASKPERNRLRQ
jgi:hypothetical protein